MLLRWASSQSPEVTICLYNYLYPRTESSMKEPVTHHDSDTSNTCSSNEWAHNWDWEWWNGSFPSTLAHRLPSVPSLFHKAWSFKDHANIWLSNKPIQSYLWLAFHCPPASSGDSWQASRWVKSLVWCWEVRSGHSKPDAPARKRTQGSCSYYHQDLTTNSVLKPWVRETKNPVLLEAKALPSILPLSPPWRWLPNSFNSSLEAEDSPESTRIDNQIPTESKKRTKVSGAGQRKSMALSTWCFLGHKYMKCLLKSTTRQVWW